jgi:prepilin-type N-terminal cleavage/methylation domain-containing protein
VLQQLRSRIDYQDKNLVQKGFTLVELLVVIVILGVLAAVVVFAVGGITNSSKSSACKIEVRTVNTAVQAFFAQNSRYPTAVEAPTAAGLITFFTTAAGNNLLQTGAGTATSAFTPTYTAGSAAGNNVFAASCP